MQYYISIRLLLLVSLFLVASTSSAAAQKTYNKDGLKLSYPAKWQITDEQKGKNYKIVAIESEDGVSLSMQLSVKNKFKSLAQYAKIAAKHTNNQFRQGFAKEKSLKDVKVSITSKFSNEKIQINSKRYNAVVEETKVSLNEATPVLTNKVYYFKFNNGDTDAYLSVGSANDDKSPLKQLIQSSLKSFEFKDQKWK